MKTNIEVEKKLKEDFLTNFGDRFYLWHEFGYWLNTIHSIRAQDKEEFKRMVRDMKVTPRLEGPANFAGYWDAGFNSALNTLLERLEKTGE